MLLASEKRTATTILVAASDAPGYVKGSARFVCDGSLDDVQINAALALLLVGGGKVELSDGNFSIGNSIALTTGDHLKLNASHITGSIDELISVEDASGVTIEGINPNVSIIEQDGATGEDAVVFNNSGTSTYRNINLKNFQVLGNASSGDGIRFDHAGASGAWQRVRIENVYGFANGGNGLEINPTVVDFRVSDSEFRFNGENGIEILSTEAKTCTTIRLTENYLWDNVEYGLQVTNGGLTINTVVGENNIIELNDAGGISIGTVAGFIWTGNHMEGESGLTQIAMDGGTGKISGNKLSSATTGISFTSTSAGFVIEGNSIAGVTTGIAFGTTTGVFQLAGNQFGATNAYTGGDSASIIFADTGTGGARGPLSISPASDGGVAYRVRRTNDTADVFAIFANGFLNWGSGSATADVGLIRAAANVLQLSSGDSFRPEADSQLLGDSTHQWRVYHEVIATASLPAAAASMDGVVLIEDAGDGDRNLIIYAGGQRFRIDGGSTF